MQGKSLQRLFTQAMNEQALRHEICRVGKSLFERGYAHATAGNISARVPAEEGGGYLITPTDACLGFLDPDALARVDEDGRQLGGKTASKTLALHRHIYGADPSARCVIHTHSTHLVRLTIEGVWQRDCILPPITPYFVMKVGRVPLIPYRRPGSPEAALLVAEAIAQARDGARDMRAVMLDRLGPNVWGATPAAAMATLEELEETAKLWLCAGRAAAPLDEAAIAELQQAFGARW
jgi:ribulose-5-phosphate 4-epimerase/fuculose-1-phosphate aldolase